MRTLILAVVVALVAVVGMAYAADVTAPAQTAVAALVTTTVGTVAKIDGTKVTLTVKPAVTAKEETKVVDIAAAKVEGKLAVGAKVVVTEVAGKVTVVKVTEEVKAPVVSVTKPAAPAKAPAAEKKI